MKSLRFSRLVMAGSVVRNDEVAGSIPVTSTIISTRYNLLRNSFLSRLSHSKS